MKKTLRLSNLTALAIFLGVTNATLAQSGGRFTLQATVIASGGSAAHAGRFSIEATIGQPAAAAPISSARFQLESGFWTSVTVQQTPGAPELKIELLPGGFVRLSWPLAATGFSLEACSDLATNVWQPAKATLGESAIENTAVVPAAGSMRCYRLKK